MNVPNKIQSPDAGSARKEAMDELVVKLKLLEVGQSIPVSPAIEPLLLRVLKTAERRSFKIKGKRCWRVG